ERTPGGIVQPKNYQPAKRPRRQDWSGEWLENGAFYICRRDGLLESQCRLHGKIAYWTMPVRSAFEIDTPDDWHVLESLAHQVRGEKLAKLEVAEPQLLISDVDGVLTDGGMYYGPEGEALKKFSTRDGMGFKRWREAGKTVAIVTGENSPSVAARAAKLQVTDLHLGIQDKLPVVQAIAEKHGLRLNQVAYIGDDINDEEAMRAVGWSACPQDAEPAIQEIAHYRCQRRGGEGCVREFIDRLLSGKN
ncbi:MAG: N-acylneuraminate cytidylyltransferase, partial [Polyangiaceae bacterium]|nr:N-acylneuraminate cytidylyltransferase [Polyangiaceae bacterium]